MGDKRKCVQLAKKKNKEAEVYSKTVGTIIKRKLEKAIIMT
jgi:hypothetical protein